MFLPLFFSIDGNGFTGTVPTEIGHLKGLENLDLCTYALVGILGIVYVGALTPLLPMLLAAIAYNYLNSGPLPTEIVQLTGLQWISLRKSFYCS